MICETVVSYPPLGAGSIVSG